MVFGPEMVNSKHRFVGWVVDVNERVGGPPSRRFGADAAPAALYDWSGLPHPSDWRYSGYRHSLEVRSARGRVNDNNDLLPQTGIISRNVKRLRAGLGGAGCIRWASSGRRRRQTLSRRPRLCPNCTSIDIRLRQ